MSETLLSAPTEAAPAPEAAPAAAPDARAWLPEEFRADPTFKDLSDAGSLAKAYKNAASMVGLDKATILKLPKDGDEAGMAEIFAKLGRPEKPDGYDVKLDGAPPEAVTAFRDTAHKLGLSAKQVAGLTEFYGALGAGTAEQRQAAETQTTQKTVATIREQWGAAFSERTAAIEQLVQQSIGEKGFEQVNALIKGGHVEMLNLLADAAGRMNEPAALKGGSGGGQQGAMTPAAAQSEVARLSGDREFTAKLMNRDAPGHADAKAQWDRINQMAYAGGTPVR